MRHIHVEALLKWTIRLLAQVPFTKMPGRIARIVQGFG